VAASGIAAFANMAAADNDELKCTSAAQSAWMSEDATKDLLKHGWWDTNTFRIVPNGETTEEFILVAQYEDVKDEILDTSSGTPWRVTIMPNNTLRFEGTPDAADTFKGDYYRGPDEDELAANTDESSIPSRFHRVILGRALILYANYESAPEAKIQGQEIFEDYLARLENHQLPNRDHARYRTGAEIVVRTE
jgi:hypothetical protein